MAMDKQKRLVQLLLGKTEKGEVHWTPGPTDSSYLLSMRESGLQIRDVNLDYFIDMIDEKGEIADSFSDVELHNNRSEQDWSDSWFNTLQYLYNLARRNSRGADKVLSDILSELER